MSERVSSLSESLIIKRFFSVASSRLSQFPLVEVLAPRKGSRREKGNKRHKGLAGG